MLSYELCKQLKEAGFPQMGVIINLDKTPPCEYGQGKGKWKIPDDKDEMVYEPTLEELIKELGDHFGCLVKTTSEEIGGMPCDLIIYGAGTSFNPNDWQIGSHPDQAVAYLYLKIKNKHHDSQENN